MLLLDWLHLRHLRGHERYVLLLLLLLLLLRILLLLLLLLRSHGRHVPRVQRICPVGVEVGVRQGRVHCLVWRP